MKLLKSWLAIFFALFLLGNAMAASSTSDNKDWWIDVKNDRVSAMKEDISKGQDINALTPEGHTALIYAYREGAMKSVNFLLSQPNININQESNFGETILMYAALDGKLDLVKTLVEKGAQINKLGWAPIHYATIKGRVDVLDYLLQKGAWPNSPAPDGSSPLFMAVNARNDKEVSLLIKAGADPNAVNQKGMSALDLAKSFDDQDLIKLLEQK